MLDVSVIVPSHGAAKTMPRLLDALAAQELDRERFEVLVVDLRADGTERLIEERAEGWPDGGLRLVPAPMAGGPAAKRNLGARAARGRVLAFTDADCEPDPGWLAAGLRATGAGHGLVQGRTVPPDPSELFPLANDIWVEGPYGLYETCNIFYARELFARLGGFTTRYFSRYGSPFGEDAELGWRARREGARFAFEPEALVVHPPHHWTLRAHLREQWRARGFPELVRDAPELREEFLHNRVFLSPDSARFLAAAAGVALGRRFPPAALLALPYARGVARRARSAPPGRRAELARVAPLSSAVLAAALAVGSARARTLVL